MDRQRVAYDTQALGKAARATDDKAPARTSFLGINIISAGALFMARLGIAGAYWFPICLLTTPIGLGVAFAKGQADLSLPRLVLYLIMTAGAVISLLLSLGQPGAQVSFQSLLLFLGLYALFLFPIRLSDSDYIRYFRMLANLGAVFCVIGAAQYFLQYLLHAQWIFSWRGIVPSQFLLEFNTLNATSYGSGIYKANGFFLLEASHLSQLGARALLIATVILRDPRYIIPTLLGMLTAYSGTGFLLLLPFGLIPILALLFSQRGLAPFMMIGLLAAPLALMVLWQPLNLGLFIDRLGEFNAPGSSAYGRFSIAGEMASLFSKSDLPTFLFGSGPGMALYYAGVVGNAFTNTWVKLIADYGVFGLVSFSVFFGYCVHSSTKSWLLTVGFLLAFLVLDGALVVPQQVVVALMLGGLVVRKPSAAPSQPATAAAS
jgi:hypothetical protein